MVGADAGPSPNLHCRNWNLFFHPGDLDVMLLVISGTMYFFGLKTSKLHVTGELIGCFPVLCLSYIGRRDYW